MKLNGFLLSMIWKKVGIVGFKCNIVALFYLALSPGNILKLYGEPFACSSYRTQQFLKTN